MQKGKSRMETVECFMNFVTFLAREQAQSQVYQLAEQTTNAINRHYILASLSTKRMVSNEGHKREHQVNQSHASGSNHFKFNGADEVLSTGG